VGVLARCFSALPLRLSAAEKMMRTPAQTLLMLSSLRPVCPAAAAVMNPGRIFVNRFFTFVVSQSTYVPDVLGVFAQLYGGGPTKKTEGPPRIGREPAIPIPIWIDRIAVHEPEGFDRQTGPRNWLS